MKRALMIVAALGVSFGVAPQVRAGDDGWYPSGGMTQCGAQTCTVYECQTNFNTGQEVCSAIYSYPRPREVSGE
jgi:hypothetical protein